MWLSSQGVTIEWSLDQTFGWGTFQSCLVFLPEVTALSTLSAATGTSASLEMKTVHLLARDRLTTSLKVQKFIRKP